MNDPTKNENLDIIKDHLGGFSLGRIEAYSEPSDAWTSLNERSLSLLAHFVEYHDIRHMLNCLVIVFMNSDGFLCINIKDLLYHNSLDITFGNKESESSVDVVDLADEKFRENSFFDIKDTVLSSKINEILLLSQEVPE